MTDPDAASDVVRDPMPTSEPVRRTIEIEDVTNLHFVHPIANRLTPVLARFRVPANAVSLAGMALGISAGFAYFRYQEASYAVAGFVLMIAWHVMDGVDGQLARLTNSQSEFGKVLDGICDYVTFIAVYAALAVRLGRDHGGFVWPLVIAAAVCHAVQSAAYEAQRQYYDFWGWGRQAREPARRAATAARPSNSFARAQLLLHATYARVQLLAIGSSLDLQRKLASRLASQPERAASLRRSYRETFAAPLRRWSVLSANYRTIGIFVCALLKSPLFYFCFEIIGLSLILVILTARQHSRLAIFVGRHANTP